jgi:soluble lytic murein transglycosylase-like protein
MAAAVCLVGAATAVRAQVYGGEMADGSLVLSYIPTADATNLLVSAPPVPAPAIHVVPMAAKPLRPAAALAAVGPVPKLPVPYRALFLKIARETRVPVALIAAVAAAESGFDPLARSPKGATGLMQLMPDTARRFNVIDLLSPEQNLRGGASYLRWLSDRFANDMERVIAAYNAGENAVDRAGGTPPIPETQEYLPRVLRYLEHFDKTLGSARPV